MITADMKVLKAMLNLAGDKDIRTYINGVMVEVVDDHIRYTATDGAVCGIFRHIPLGNGEAGAVFIPRDVIKQCKVVGKAAAPALIDPVARTLRFGGASYSWGDVGTFPAYRRIFPDKVSGEFAAYDPGLVLAFKETAQALRNAGYDIAGLPPQIGMNGTSGALVRAINNAMKKDDVGYSPDFIGVIMPWRQPGEDVTDCPAWVQK
jgi:hypothetical protein